MGSDGDEGRDVDRREHRGEVHPRERLEKSLHRDRIDLCEHRLQEPDLCRRSLCAEGETARPPTDIAFRDRTTSGTDRSPERAENGWRSQGREEIPSRYLEEWSGRGAREHHPREPLVALF